MPGHISHICSMPNDLCDSLLLWLSTFDVVNYVSYTAEELTDGLVLATVLNEVSIQVATLEIMNVLHFQY